MITRICGSVVEQNGNEVIVQTTGGVGYRVTTPAGVVQLGESDSPPDVHLRIYHQQTERGQALFGFATEAQERVFHMLVRVQGLGPATACNVLSMDGGVRHVLTALASGDSKAMAKAVGVGKKTAENIVHHCRDKARTLLDAMEVGEAVSSDSEQVIEALVTSGYDRTLAGDVVRGLTAQPGFLRDMGQLLKAALREIGRNG